MLYPSVPAERVENLRRPLEHMRQHIQQHEKLSLGLCAGWSLWTASPKRSVLQARLRMLGCSGLAVRVSSCFLVF